MSGKAHDPNDKGGESKYKKIKKNHERIEKQRIQRSAIFFYGFHMSGYKKMGTGAIWALITTSAKIMRNKNTGKSQSFFDNMMSLKICRILSNIGIDTQFIARIPLIVPHRQRTV